MCPFPGVKTTMMFKHDEQRVCDGVVFVRLNPRNRSLISMVCEDNPNAPKPTPTSATCIKALAGMMHMRNKAQSELMKPADGCSLFSDVTPKKPTRRPRVARSEKKEKRANAASMTIEVEHKEVTHSIEVLRPIEPRDGLWVKYDEDTMGVVVDLLRCSEWQDPEPWGEATGVKGIWKKDKGFIVDLRKVSNSGPKYKTAKTLDEAVAVLSEASQQPEPDTDKADDMDETIQVMEQDAEESVEPVDTHVEQSTAESSYQDDGDNA